MDLRASRAAAALAVLPLASGTLALLPGVVGGSASAACAPSVSVRTTASHAAKRAKVHAAKPVVAKLRKKKYVAKVVVTAKQGSATVAVTQSICPDGASGAAATTTQTASGTGVTTKAVSAKGRSKKAATKAVKRKEKAVKAKLRKQGATKKGRKKAKKRAAAAARPIAAAKAHDALYLSSVTYVSVDSGGVYHLTSAAPAGKLATTLKGSPSGDIVLSVPAGFDPGSMEVAFACLRRAPAWPTAFVFDGGNASSAQLPAFASTHSTPSGVEDIVTGDVEGSTAPKAAGQVWNALWQRKSATDRTVTYSAGLGGGPIPASAGDTLVCFGTNDAEAGAYAVTLHGAHVGIVVSDIDSEGYQHVVGGVPVRIR